MPSETPSDLLEDVCAERPSVDSETLAQIVTLAVELAREGREGRKVGTIFTVGDAQAVLDASQPMILDPLAGHDDAARRVDTPDARETLKELAVLDGAFVISDEGVAVSAARYLDADASGQETLHNDSDKVKTNRWKSQVVGHSWLHAMEILRLTGERGDSQSRRNCDV